MKFDWHRRSLDAIHHGALTNSKRPSCFVKGVYPTHLTKSEGCYTWDTEGKRYIDFICANGTNLLGAANIQINDVIKQTLDRGALHSLSSTIEVEAAEKLKEIFPFSGKVRFLKTGTEACMAALRIAMASTGRKISLSHGYHGWSDPFISLTPPALGVPVQGQIEQFKDIDQITKYTACVILEPVITDHSPERIEYLKKISDKCEKTGTLLIFDEIISGFRWPKYSIANDTGIHPDIILLGKAIGGGLPLSAVITKPGVGEDLEWFVSSTFAGDTCALKAMMKMIELLNNQYSFKQLWIHGERFKNRFNEIYPEKLQLEGYPSRGVFKGDDTVKALFFQESCKAGILFGASWFYGFQHIDQSDTVLNSCFDILQKIKLGKVTLEGEAPQSPFAQKIRESQ